MVYVVIVVGAIVYMIKDFCIKRKFKQKKLATKNSCKNSKKKGNKIYKKKKKITNSNLKTHKSRHRRDANAPHQEAYNFEVRF